MANYRTLIAVLTLTLFSFSFFEGKSQNYRVAFGPRVGMSNGVSLKLLTKAPHMIEGMIHVAHKGTRFTGLYEYMRPFNGRTYTSGWYYFVGVGGHFANYANFEYIGLDNKITRASYVGFGVDLVAGIEYNFSAPLSFSVDFKPYYEIQTLELAPSHFLDLTFTIRHTFF